MSETEHTHHPKKRFGSKISIIVLVAIVVILLCGSLIWLYRGNLSQAKSNVFAKFPLPVALVGSRLVTGPELISRLTLANKLPDEYKSAAGDLRDTVYGQLIDSKKTVDVANSKNISVSAKEMDDEFTRVLDQYAAGDKNKFDQDLNNTYGMTEDEFKANVLKEDILQNKLAVWFNSQESLNADAYKTGKDLLNKLNSGQSFDDVAKQYTQDEATKDFAGDSGFVTSNDLLPEFRDALDKANIGDTKLVASRYGLHILKLLEKDTGGDNGQPRVHVQQIFIKTNSFEDWYSQQTNNIRVIKFLKL